MIWGALAGLATACAPTSKDTETGADATLTWHQDVGSIIESNCVSCHSEGQIGSFALDSYEAVFALREVVADAVQTRRMPPWKPAHDCRPLEHDLSLAQQDIDTLVAWVQAGAVEGDAENSVAGEPWVPPELSRVDATLSMPASYTPHEGVDDDYRCFALEWPFDEDVYVTGYAVTPGNASIVHHVIAYRIAEDDVAELDALDPEGEGYTCFGGPGVGSQAEANWLGGWAPGGFQGDLPEGTGIPVAAGTKIVLQIHYNLGSDDGGSDLTTLELMVEDSVERPAQIQPWTDPAWLEGGEMIIPAGTDDVTHSFSYALPVDLRIYTGNLHMHEIGRSAKLSLVHRDGTEECLLSISDWDFEWQQTYRYAETVELEAGTSIVVECTWDNESDEDVNWGDGTSDEMCLATMLMSF
jgi:hypothetical protein